MELPQLIDLLDETIYLCDPETYEMLYINKAGMESIGQYIETPYAGKPCYKVLQGLDSPCPFCTNRLLTEDSFYVWENTNKRLGKHYILKDKFVRLSDGRMARMEMAIDITEKQTLGENIRKKLEMETALVSCLRYLSPPNDFNDAIRLVLGELGAFHQADRAYIIEFSYEQNFASNTYEWCADGVEPQQRCLQRLDLKLMRPALDFLREKRVIHLPEIEACQSKAPALYSMLKAQDIQSLMLVPLCIKDRIVGMLGVDNPRRRRQPELMESLSFFVVSDLKKRLIEKELFHTRQYDALTELKNYDSYMDCMETLRAQPPAALGVVTADINALKQINHRYGPAFGDTYIGRVARFLEEAFPQAKIFRIGGDEFEVIWENPSHADFQEAVTLLEHLLKKEQDFTVSVGSTWAGCQIDVDAMVNYADQLMTLRKQDFYRNNVSMAHQSNSLLQEDLVAALREGLFVAYLQPKANTASGKISGAEILVRRRDPERGMIPPAEFIVHLEQEGLIKYLDFHMIEKTCALLASWTARGARLIPVSVNVSRVTLMEPDFIDRLLEIQGRYRFPRQYLELEATERIGKIERQTLLETAAGLRREGFTITLDDFGAEYSSLSLLTTLDMDVVKLDKSLIDEIDKSDKSAALAECIVNICHRFGMRCIAEGVETETQREVLRRISCDDIQGYLLSRPIPVAEFEKKYGAQLFIENKAKA